MLFAQEVYKYQEDGAEPRPERAVALHCREYQDDTERAKESVHTQKGSSTIYKGRG